MHETITLIKRTIWVAACACGWRREVTENAPRETLCGDCGKWVQFEEQSYTGPSLSEKKR